MSPDLSDALISLGRHVGRPNTESQGRETYLLQASYYSIDHTNLHVTIDRRFESGTRVHLEKICGHITALKHMLYYICSSAVPKCLPLAYTEPHCRTHHL